MRTRAPYIMVGSFLNKISLNFLIIKKAYFKKLSLRKTDSVALAHAELEKRLCYLNIVEVFQIDLITPFLGGTSRIWELFACGTITVSLNLKYLIPLTSKVFCIFIIDSSLLSS